MDDFIFVYLLINFFSMIPIAFAADKRTSGCGKAALVTLLFTPIVGFLFTLCYPTKEDVEHNQRVENKLSKIIELMLKEEE